MGRPNHLGATTLAATQVAGSGGPKDLSVRHIAGPEGHIGGIAMRFGKKKLAVAAVTIIALVGGGIAWAYFTTTGSGTGSASTGTSSTVTLHGTASTTLYPGTSSTVNFTVDNPSSGHQFVGTIHLASVTTDKPGCVVADYTMPDVVANQDVPSGNGTAITATGTLSMANTNVSQDNCKNAAVTLNLTSN
jgi:hypothetical protein